MNQLKADPVCHMTVDAESEFTADFEGKNYRFCCAGCRDKFVAAPGDYRTATDPVCRMTVPFDHDLFFDHDGIRYFFCCAACRDKFAADPASCLAANRERAAAAAPAAGRYLCPMCPEVESPVFAACPKCGMDLEPELPAAGGCCGGDGGSGETGKLRRKLWTAADLTLLVILFSMHPELVGLAAGRLSDGIAFLLGSAVIFGPGRFIVTRGLASLRTLNFNMFTLILIGVGSAYLYSCFALFFPQTLPVEMLHADGRAKLYFDPAAMIVTLIILGQLLEAVSRARTGNAIRELLELAPPTGRRIGPDGGEHEIPVADIAVGDRLRVKPGDRIPVDGLILRGSGAVDASMLTGEALPVAVKAGDQVAAGTVNTDGSFDFAAERIGRDTMLGRIAELVAAAQRSRAPIQKTVDRVAAVFVPAVVSIAALTFAAWFLLAGKFEFGLLNAVAVLLVACPCVLGLATPMSLIVGFALGARNGILVRDAESMENFRRSTVIAFDKTGTLTSGRPELGEVVPTAELPPEEILALAAAAEQGSEHPLARAILQAAAPFPRPAVASFENTPGRGVAADSEKGRIRVGSLRFLAEHRIDGDGARSESERLAAGGATVVGVALADRLVGLLAIVDPIKPGSADAVRQLRELGLTPVLLTGDGPAAAGKIAAEAGIETIHAEAMPQDKLAIIREYQKQGKVVAMVGDGVNDAAALAQADIGIAMGSGSDIALESAGIALPGSDIAGVVRAWRLSAAIARNIRRNLFFAFFYNLVMIPVAAGVLYLPFGLLLSPVWGSLAMSLSSVSVILNSLSLRRTRLDRRAP